MKIAVIGAGPAGLTAAYILSKELGTKLSQLEVFESSDDVGGMCKSLSLWNQTVDLGPHRFFSKDKRINELWLEIAGSEYEMVHRSTRIFYKQKFFDYPIRIFNALNGLGITEALRCLLSYLKQKIAPVKDTSTFEGWVTRKFGKRLYTIFFKTYSEKLWGISCTELDSDFASQRIKKLSLFEAIRNALRSRKRQNHATLVELFAYPHGGSGSIYRKMQEVIIQRGGKIHLNTEVKSVTTEKNRAAGVELENGSILKYDHIISTMPLTSLVLSMEDVPASIRENVLDLRFRNNILVYLHIDNNSLFQDQWLYIHDSELKTGRITNFRNWTPQLNGHENQTILCMEYWCNFEDDIWNYDNESLENIAFREIEKTGLVKKSEIREAYVHRIPNCYPVYFNNYRKKLDPVQQFLSGINSLNIIGRYGAYKYNNQDHSILMGMLAAENILYNKNHNLWEINTDYEEYQESAPITKTGLAADVNK